MGRSCIIDKSTFENRGGMPSVFGIHIAAPAASHSLDVEGDLGSILPAAGS